MIGYPTGCGEAAGDVVHQSAPESDTPGVHEPFLGRLIQSTSLAP